MTPLPQRRLNYLDAKAGTLEYVLRTVFAALLTPLSDDQVEALLRDMESAPISLPPDCKLTELEIDQLMADTAHFKAGFYARLRDRVAEFKAKGIGTG